MAWRTTAESVRELVESDTSISMYPFISTANSLTDYVDSKDTGGILSESMLEEIEKYLAAHFYAIRDQQYTSKSTGKASGSFQGQTGKGLDYSPWGQTAKLLDVTGCLARLDAAPRAKASMAWLGKPPSEQIDYEDRD